MPSESPTRVGHAVPPVDPPMTSTYVRVLVVQVIVLLALLALQQAFAV